MKHTKEPWPTTIQEWLKSRQPWCDDAQRLLYEDCWHAAQQNHPAAVVEAVEALKRWSMNTFVAGTTMQREMFEVLADLNREGGK